MWDWGDIMKINTTRFGEIEIERDKIITFEQGFVGFNAYKQYVLFNLDSQLPFVCLQSIEEPDLAFILLEISFFKADYSPQISQEELHELKLAKLSEAIILSVVVLPKDIKKMTANLAAPVIINPEARLGKQIVLNDKRYKIKHYILDELRDSKSKENKPVTKLKEAAVK